LLAYSVIDILPRPLVHDLFLLHPHSHFVSFEGREGLRTMQSLIPCFILLVHIHVMCMWTDLPPSSSLSLQDRRMQKNYKARSGR